MRRDLVWLIGLVMVVACWVAWLRPPPQPPATLCLKLASEADFSHCCTLTLQGKYTTLASRFPDHNDLTAGSLSQGDVAELMQALEAAGIWELKDGDDKGADTEVLYTMLEVSWHGHHSRTFWRGLNDSQMKITTVLLGSKLAPQVQSALSQVQADKQRLNTKKP